MTARKKIAIGCCCTLAAGLVVWDLAVGILWDGRFEMPIKIVRNGEPLNPKFIASVKYVARPRSVYADGSTETPATMFTAS